MNDYRIYIGEREKLHAIFTNNKKSNKLIRKGRCKKF